MLIVFYEFGVLPFLLGLLWRRKKHAMGFCSIYVHGYMTMFTLFFMLAVPMILLERSLTELAAVWAAVSAAAPVLLLALVLAQRGSYAQELRFLTGNFKMAVGRLRGMICLVALLVAFSVVWVVPSVEDDVPEIVGISVSTDTMYVYQPYTQIPYADNSEKVFSPIEMLYAAVAKLSGMNATVMIHMFVPSFLILLYVSVGWMASGYFFHSKLKERSLFAMLWMLTGTAAVCSVRALSIGILQNSWNGLTLLAECILPAAIIEGFAFHDKIMEQEKPKLPEILFLLVTLISAQLAAGKGAFLAAVVIVVCVGTAWIRKGYKNVSIIRKH